jgi:predicted porin
MKKSLLALAVLGAFAGAASAQSSVTLFGVLDVNVRYVDNGGGKQWQMNQDGINSSRLGFRGTEDLGGGLNAGFWLEGAMNPQQGTSTGQAWTRTSYVSLGGNWGQVRLGRDYTATFWNATIFDPFGTNGVGSSGNIYLVVPALPSGGAYSTLVRDNNMVGYFLPSGIAGGLYGQIQGAAGMNQAGQKYFGGRLGYAAGPFNVAGAWGRTQVLLSPETNMTNYNFGGSWDFKFLQLMGYYGRLEAGQGTQSNWYLAAQAPIGLWTLKASYGDMWRNGNAFGVSINDQKADQIALGAQYDLSKRTALYANYAYIHNQGGAAFVVGGLNNVVAGGARPNDNSQGFEVGVRHSF